ncbi:MAG: 4-hydroxy-tetrahydrodipicolinate reductase [Promethearchaeota archaeon]
MIKIGILGSDGSMGRYIIPMAIKDKELSIISAYTIPNSENIGSDIGTLASAPPQNVKIRSVEKLENDLKVDKPDVFVDFTVASATEKNARIIIKNGIPMVIGTTGLSQPFIEDIKRISAEKEVPLVISSNMAVGVNVLFKIAAELARRLQGWEIEITETHHHRKKDVPSGTALTILKYISEARKIKADKVAKYGRTKGPNPRKWGNEEIGIHAIRGGDIVGDHVVLYAGEGERIELKHQAHSRDCFASGAIKAVKFLVNKVKNKNKSRIFNMQDVLFE